MTQLQMTLFLGDDQTPNRLTIMAALPLPGAWTEADVVVADRLAKLILGDDLMSQLDTHRQRVYVKAELTGWRPVP